MPKSIPKHSDIATKIIKTNGRIPKSRISKVKPAATETISVLEQKIGPDSALNHSPNPSVSSAPPSFNPAVPSNPSAPCATVGSSPKDGILSSSPKIMESDAPSLKDSLRQLCYPVIPAEKFFILCTGEPITHLLHLAHFLDTMSDEVFYYHVTGSRNDFANWIRDVFDDPQLALLATQAVSRVTLRALLYAHIIRKIEPLLLK